MVGFLCAGVLLSSAATRPPRSRATGAADLQQVQALALKQPLAFEENRGQTDGRVRFLSRSSGGTLFLTGNEAVFTLNEPSPRVHSQPGSRPNGDRSLKPIRQHAIRMRLTGARSQPRLAGEAPLPGRVNYFRGNDPKKWVGNVPQYSRVKYASVYPGVDLVYHGRQGRLEYDFIVAPGADPQQIRLSYGGAEKLSLDDRGDLLLQAGRSTLRQHRPVAYQLFGDRRVEVPAEYDLREAAGVGGRLWGVGKVPSGRFLNGTVPQGHHPYNLSTTPAASLTFRLGTYDRSRPLIIDPTIAYSTYLGGNGDDHGCGIALDQWGNIYLTGMTASTNFPMMVPYQPATAGNMDIYVTKFSRNAAGVMFLAYSSYLGGSGSEGQNINNAGRAIAVDNAGNAYVTGFTNSTDFPTLNALQSSFQGMEDGFVAKLDTTLSGIPSLRYATYLGGNKIDRSLAIALDDLGYTYVTGQTQSPNFPTLGSLQTLQSWDVFVTKLDTTASGSASLISSTYLGGNYIDYGRDIAVHGTGMVYVTGETWSANFPIMYGFMTTASAPSQPDGFLTRLNMTVPGTVSMMYSTPFGGTAGNQFGGGDSGSCVAVDGTGMAYVGGWTASSTSFPLKNAYQTIGSAQFSNAFVMAINTNLGGGPSLIYSTFLGGSSDDAAFGIALDTAGYVYVTGGTRSANFPTLNGFQGFAGAYPKGDAFITKLDPNAVGAASLVWSSFLGGTASDEGEGIALDAAGNVYVTGWTLSTNFPTLIPFQTDQPLNDAFLTKISPASPGQVSLSATAYSVNEVDTSVTLTVNRTGNLSLPAAVNYTTTQGTASSFSDYTAPALGTVTFNPGVGSATITIPVADDRDLENPETFTVTLTGAVGAVVASPSTATVTIQDDIVKPAPDQVDFQVTAPNAVRVQWIDQCHNEGLTTSSTGFEIQRASSSSGPWLNAGTRLPSSPQAMNGAMLFKQFTGLTPQASYWYRVRAVRGTLASVYSAPAQVSLSLPTNPNGLSAVADSCTALHLLWTDMSNNEQSFQVSRTPGGMFTAPAKPGSGTMVYWADNGLSPSTTYVYKVRAINGAGFSAYTVPTTITLLPAPTGLTATPAISGPSNTQVILNWTDTTTMESGFRIYRSVQNGPFLILAQVPANTTTYTNSGLTNNKLYKYYVKARCGTSLSAASNTASAQW